MADALYRLTEELLNIREHLHLVHPQSQHILHVSEGRLSIFLDSVLKNIENHISKIEIQLTQNEITSDYVLFFKNEIVDICAKRKSNLLFEIHSAEMERMLLPFFEMEEIKEPSN